MTILLALDFGTISGRALLMPDGQILSGMQSFKPSRYEGGGTRYLRFCGSLAELQAGASAVGEAHLEGVCRLAGVDAAQAYGGLPTRYLRRSSPLHLFFFDRPLTSQSRMATSTSSNLYA